METSSIAPAAINKTLVHLEHLGIMPSILRHQCFKTQNAKCPTKKICTRKYLFSLNPDTGSLPAIINCQRHYL